LNGKPGMKHKANNKPIKKSSNRIDKIAKENPDLPRAFIKDILKAQREMREGKAMLYISNFKK
jgi:hypothetical protein